MSAPTDPTKPTDAGAESPTTMRPLDLSDDDDIPESAGLTGPATNTTTAATTATTSAPMSPTPPSETEPPVEGGPPKPPRPLTETQKNEMILKEAFPAVEAGVIKAVLSASRGQVESAFNALLEMTDPDAVRNEPEVAPPPQPPRPTGRAAETQMEADERYARQLAEHYDNAGAYEARTSNRSGRPTQGWGPQGNDPNREHSFMDDDLPIIRENLRQGFAETQTQVNGWISTMRKKIEETFGEDEPGQSSAQRPGQSGRPSGDYDADPQVLGDDFARMRFAGDGTPIEPRTSSMNYRAPQSQSPRPSDGRRVGFKEETEEINMYDSSPKVPPKDTPPTSAAKASKWQPLSNMDPSPITDNDPFSLGDSEDEKEAKEKPKETATETPKEATSDAERLKQAAAEAMADDLVVGKEGDSSKKS